jgi:hypothetical protein
MGGMDSGLVVILTILVFLIGVLFTSLLYVNYEWCPVLFLNNTVCSKYKLIFRNI